MKLSSYRPILVMAIQSVAAGFGILVLLHYALPAAEHPRIMSTMGLLIDIVGIIWVAYDIFPFAGKEEYGEDDAARSGIETPEYKAFKRSHVVTGLQIVVIGFFFQILSYWVEDVRQWLP